MSRSTSTKIGILGAGQLGRMLSAAAHQLGLTPSTYDPNPESPSRWLSVFQHGEYTDPASIKAFAAQNDIITYELEHLPSEVLSDSVPAEKLRPNISALRLGQDRLFEKELFSKLQIETGRYAAADSPGEIERALAQVGYPAVIKTRTAGYDGKGQFVVRSAAELTEQKSRFPNVPLLVEAFVPFDREVSIVAVRSSAGDINYYPLVENVHERGILITTRAPAPDITPALQEKAESAIRGLLDHFNYVGVLALELFQLGDRLLANELAPRVHNTGHWTIEGAVTSQFENHIRAIAGLPLGSCEPRGFCAMVNIIGAEPPLASLLAEPTLHVHYYSKEPMPGRKIGHATLVCSTAEERDAQLARVRGLMPPQFSS